MGAHRTGEDWAMNHLDPPAIAAFCFAACGLITIVAQLGQWLGFEL